MNTLPFVSILTLNWNARDTTLKWLSQLRDIDYPRDRLEIIIHDNASRDGSQKALRDELYKMKNDGWRNIILIESSEHPGVTEAFNRAYARASGDSEYILRLDNDVVLDHEALKIMLLNMERSQNAGVVGCKVILYEGDALGKKRDIFSYGPIFINPWTGWTRVIESDEITSCDIVIGAVMLVKREVVENLEFFFDPFLFFFHEEGDLCLRIKSLGYSVIFNPEAVAFHEYAKSSGKTPNLCRYLNRRNAVILARRHLRLHNRISCYIVFVLQLLKALVKRDWPSYQGIRDGLFHRNKLLTVEWWREALKNDLQS